MDEVSSDTMLNSFEPGNVKVQTDSDMDSLPTTI